MAENQSGEDLQEQQKQLGSYLGKLLRDHFGKGPESVYVSIDPHCIVMHIRKFLSPMEQVIMGQRNQEAVEELRETMMEQILPEVKHYLSRIADIEGWEFYFDWNIENRSGMITALNSQELKTKNEKKRPEYIENIKRKVNDVSAKTEKIPDDIAMYQINERTLIAARTGILILIEKELISLGHGANLKTAKRHLEKQLLNEIRFDKLFGAKVHDIFVDWDFYNDTSVVVFVTDPVSAAE